MERQAGDWGAHVDSPCGQACEAAPSTAGPCTLCLLWLCGEALLDSVESGSRLAATPDTRQSPKVGLMRTRIYQLCGLGLVRCPLRGAVTVTCTWRLKALVSSHQ